MIYKSFSTRTSPLGDPFGHGSLTFGIPDFNKINVDTLAILPWSPNPNSTTSTNIQGAHQTTVKPHGVAIQPKRPSHGAHKRSGDRLCEGGGACLDLQLRAD